MERETLKDNEIPLNDIKPHIYYNSKSISLCLRQGDKKMSVSKLKEFSREQSEYSLGD